MQQAVHKQERRYKTSSLAANTESILKRQHRNERASRFILGLLLGTFLKDGTGL